MNIAPIDSQEVRHHFAIIARGEEKKTREIGFYSNFMDKSNCQQGCPIPSMHNIGQPEPDHPHMDANYSDTGTHSVVWFVIELLLLVLDNYSLRYF